MAACVAILASAAPASAAPAALGDVTKVSTGANGAQRLLYRIGRFPVNPGQKAIGTRIIAEKPQVDGWITRIGP